MGFSKFNICIIFFSSENAAFPPSESNQNVNYSTIDQSEDPVNQATFSMAKHENVSKAFESVKGNYIKDSQI